MFRFVPAARLSAIFGAAFAAVSVGLAQGGQWQTECPACAQHLGGPGVYRYPTKASCDAVVARELADHFPFTACHLVGGTAGAGTNTSTGSMTGDMVNLGAQMWILQNVKNPYTAVFAQNFTTGFLRGLFANDTPEAQRARAAAEANLRREQEERAAREREAAQQRLDAMFARLNSQLKLSGGTTQLALKTSTPLENLPMKLSSGAGGLPMKMSDIAAGEGYGISGLPGIYTNGPATGDAATGGLKLKTGDGAGDAAASPPGTGMGIAGLPGLNLPSGIDLNHVTPQQAPQVADASLAIGDPQQRGAVEEIALQAAAKDPELNKPSDDPFVQDYHDEKKSLDAAKAASDAALQKASEAQGRAQADQTALAYAQQQIAAGQASEPMKQAYAQMQDAARSDEEVAAQARAMFEGTQVELTIRRDRAADTLAALAPPPAVAPGTALKTGGLVLRGPSSDSIPKDALAGSAVTAPASRPGLSPTAKPQPMPGAPIVGYPLAKPLDVCVAEAANKAPYQGAAPTQEELKHQLEGAQEAYKRLVETQEHENESKADVLKDMAKANVDMSMGFLDKAMDDLLGSEKSMLNDVQHDLRMDTAWTRLQVNDLEQQLASQTLDQAKRDELGQLLIRVNLRRSGLRDGAEAIRDARTIYSVNYMGRPIRDAYLWGTGSAGSWDEFKKENAWTQMKKKIDLSNIVPDDKTGVDKWKSIVEHSWDLETSGDLEEYMDGVKQVVKIGMSQKAVKAWLGVIKVGGAETGATELYEGLSLFIDTSYDLLVDGLGYQRLLQIKDNTVKLSEAKAMLAGRIRQTQAQMRCYERPRTVAQMEAAR